MSLTRNWYRKIRGSMALSKFDQYGCSSKLLVDQEVFIKHGDIIATQNIILPKVGLL